MKICVYAICKNEEKFVDRWLSSMREADGIYVLDTGSSDATVKLLTDGGAHVTVREVSPWRFDRARNLSLSLVPPDADVCVCTDLDEYFHPGWREKLEQAWTEDCLRAYYRYTWNFNEDGSEGYVFRYSKIHRRWGVYWLHPVHEILAFSYGVTGKSIFVDGIQLDHKADPAKSRGQYLPLLELSVSEMPSDDRNTHYLGREYYFYGRWEDSIKTLKRHLSLPSATWKDERAASMRYISKCYFRLGNPAEGEAWMLRAIAEAPHLREPLIDAATYYLGIKNWEGVIFFTKKALSLSEKTSTYITEKNAYGALPHDLLSVALFYEGKKCEALAEAEKAHALSPHDGRIGKNVDLIRAALSADPQAQRIEDQSITSNRITTSPSAIR